MGAGQHAKFIERLRGSKRGVFAFAYWLSARGHWIEIPSTEEAPTAADHPDYIDKGDLFAWKAGFGRKLRIEVKTLGITFSGKGDWPFSEVFVSSVASVDRSLEEVHAWVSVSHDLAAAVIVKQTTWETWTIKTGLVSNTGNVESNYACPLEEAKFISLSIG
jgi:hypothetical protein